MNMTREVEWDLIHRSQNGDQAAFESLVRDSIDGLYRVAYRFMGSVHEAEDMVQEAYFKGYKSLKRFRGDSRFKTWMTRVLINICKDNLAKRKGHRVPEPIEQAEMIKSKADSPYDSAVRDEMGSKIHDAFQKLPTEEREVAVLVLVENMSYAQVSKIVKASEGTIAWRLFEARKRLSRYLKEYKEGSEMNE